MGRKAKRKSPTPEVFQVEVILAARVNDDGEWEYHVKWANYPDEDNSWEPHENVQECHRLLTSFWAHVGVDNDDYPIGYCVEAKTHWINKEKAFFAVEFFQQQKTDKKAKDKQASKEPETSKNKKKSSRKKNDDSKFGASASSSKGKGKEKATVAQDTVIIGDSDDSDDDTPLVNSYKTNSSALDTPHIQHKSPPRKRSRAAIISDSDSPDPEPPRKLSKIDASTAIKVVEPQATTSASQTSAALFEPANTPSSQNSLFSGGSGSPVQPKAPPPRTSSKPQPKIKLIDIQPHNASSMTTKQRIFQKSSSGSASVMVVTEPHRKNSLANISFKKNKTVPIPPRISRGGSQSEAEPKSAQGSKFTDDRDIFASPASDYHMQHDIPQASSSWNQHQDAPAPETGVFESQLSASEAANEFLSQLNLPAIVPMDVSEPAPEPIPEEPIVPSLRVSRPAAPLRKIPKKWKWTGELLVDVGPSQTETICTITISEPTDPPENAMRLSILMSSIDTVRMQRRLHMGDLEAILPACGPVQQLAKLGCEDSEGEIALKSLADYMGRKKQVAMIPLYLDNLEVASLLIFPSSLHPLWRRFKVPVDLQQASPFITAVIPWKMSTADYFASGIEESYAISTGTKGKRPGSHAMAFIEFPKDLRLFMSRPDRNYCVWWSSGDGTTAPGWETNQLLKILNSCKAKNVGHKADVRVVFVHVGALRTLHKLPALAERRNKVPQLQFYTYGTHPSIPRKQWGVHEIYPLGGIVTFTPEALFQNPLGAVKVMEQIAEHPCWTCYLLPSVVGMAAKVSCLGADPVSEFNDGYLLISQIVKLIAEGKVSLLQAPPLYGDDPTTGWVNSQTQLLSLDAAGLLKECLNSFAARYSNAPAAQLSDNVQTEIFQDLLRMQTQPAIRDAYRRFVIITTPGSSKANMHQDGFEWPTADKFNFRDDFFRKIGHAPP